MLIKEAEESNIPQLVEMTKKFVDFHIEIYPPEHKPYMDLAKNYDKKLSHFFAKHIKKKKSTVFIAEEQNTIVGYGVVKIEKFWEGAKLKNLGLLESIWVEQQYRQKGLGKKIFNQMIEWLKNKKVKHAKIDVASINKAAINWYIKEGFSICNVDMRKKL
jgi:ribosomal protein S18 acetylase RimI-like enzyme